METKIRNQIFSHVNSANESLDMLEGVYGHENNGKRKYIYFNIKFKVREDDTHKTTGLTKMLKRSQMINSDNDD